MKSMACDIQREKCKSGLKGVFVILLLAFALSVCGTAFATEEAHAASFKQSCWTSHATSSYASNSSFFNNNITSATVGNTYYFNVGTSGCFPSETLLYVNGSEVYHGLSSKYDYITSGYDWYNYTFNNTGTITYYWEVKYKYSTSSSSSITKTLPAQSVTVRKTPTLSFAASSKSVEYGSTCSNSLSNSGDGKVTYTSSDTSIAAVDSSTGTVTPKKAGSCTITATSAQTSTYESATASYTLTVNRKTPTLSFSWSSRHIDYGTTWSNTLSNSGDGKVTYTSSDTSIATVDSSTGTVTPKKVGSCTITVTAAQTDTYEKATKSYDLYIDRKAISIPSANYNLTYSGKTLYGMSDGEGYTLGGTYYATNAGTYTAVLTLDDNYEWSSGSTSSEYVEWTISPLDISSSKVSVSGISSSYYYTGYSIDPEPTLKCGSETLSNYSDYYYSIDDNLYPGLAEVFIEGTGNFTGYRSEYFTIECTPLSHEDMEVYLYGTKYTYTGKAIRPGVGAYMLGYGYYTNLYEDEDYTVSYTNNVKLGTATVTVKGIGCFTGQVTKTFKIVAPSGKAAKAYATAKSGGAKASLSLASVSGIKSSYTYTGKARKPSPTLKMGSFTLKKGTDYTVSYKANKKVGLATMTIKGKGAFKGAIKKTFKIVPKGTTFKSLTATSYSSALRGAGIGISIKKQSQQTSGYQVRISVASNFKGAKSYTIKGSSKTKVKLGKEIKIKRGKTYYLQVRTYKKVGKKNYYSPWSDSLDITVP